MAPKAPPSLSSSSASESASSGASSSEEKQEEVAQATPPPKKAVPNGKPPVADDDSDSDEEDEQEDDEGEEDEEDSDGSGSPPKPAPKEGTAASAVKAPADDADSESESSESDAKPPPPGRSSHGPDPSIKPISSKPMDGAPKGKTPSFEKPKPSTASAPDTEKRKRQESESGEEEKAAANGPSAKRGKKGSQTSRPRPLMASPSKSRSGFALAKRLVFGGEDAEEKPGASYPRLREAIDLLEEEDGYILGKGSLSSALEVLKPAVAKVLEDRWDKHFLAGFKYFVERAALKEELLRSLVEVLESQ